MIKISEVFTPRSAKVNLKTYVPRLILEQELLRSIQGSMHTLLFGESGNGKSWMYKKVLDQNGIPYFVANCANASRLKSLTNEIITTLTPTGTALKTGYSEQKEASIKAVIAEGKLVHEGHYVIQRSDPLEEAFSKVRSKHPTGSIVVVIDNLESIFDNKDRMEELADIIILLDDERYAQYNIKYLIVGVPNGVLEYFAKTKNLESVANRLAELKKVEGLTTPMVATLVKTGFTELLRIRLSEEEVAEISAHIHHVTLGVAQRVQEYCEKLAYAIEDNKGTYNTTLLRAADIEWLRLGLRQGYTVIESHLNAKRTAVARRNQVIYCIGQIKAHQIDSNKIKEAINIHFPSTMSEQNMGISGILSELAGGDAPIIKKNPKTNEYRVVDPRYIMCIRAMLKKPPNTEIVEKLSFSF